MDTYRGETFESNSSQTHSYVNVSDDDYQSWKKGDLYFNFMEWSPFLCTLSNIKDHLRNFKVHEDSFMKEHEKKVEVGVPHALEMIDKLERGEINSSNEDFMKALEDVDYWTFKRFRKMINGFGERWHPVNEIVRRDWLTGKVITRRIGYRGFDG